MYNLTDKVHADGHTRGEEQTQLLQNQNLLRLLETDFSHLVSFDRVAEEESAVDEAFAREENSDLGVPVLLELGVDPKPGMNQTFTVSLNLQVGSSEVQITTLTLRQGPCLTCAP